MWAVSNSLWAPAMADARTNIEAIIEAYLRRRTRLHPTGIVHRRYSKSATDHHSLERSGARRGPGRQNLAFAHGHRRMVVERNHGPANQCRAVIGGKGCPRQLPVTHVLPLLVGYMNTLTTFRLHP